MFVKMWSLHQVNFSSLDVHLHTEALLNSMNFLNNLLPPMKKETQEEQPVPPKEEEEEEEEAKIEDSAVAKKSSKKVRCLFFYGSFILSWYHFSLIFLAFSSAYKKSKFEDVVNLHIRADLNCLKVFIRGEKAQISEISIEGNTHFCRRK